MSEPPASYSIPTDSAELLERRRRLLGPAYRLFYEEPLHIVKGEGVWLTDAGGRRYLDMYNNVPHVGHCHPQVVEAIRRGDPQSALEIHRSHKRRWGREMNDILDRLNL